MIRDFERKHRCCGFFNVFDHCTENYRLDIIYETVERNAMESFWENADMFENYDSFSSSDSGLDWSSSVADRGGTAEYIPDYYGDYDSVNSELMETAPETGGHCDAIFAVAEPPYYHMPCRPDLMFPNGPPRNVSQTCVKPPGEARVCHLTGCQEAYYDLISQYLSRAIIGSSVITFVYFVLVLHIFWRRVIKNKCGSEYRQGRRQEQSSCCTC